MKEVEDNKVWTQRDGTKILISKMSDEHLKNAIKMIEDKMLNNEASISYIASKVGFLTSDWEGFFNDEDCKRMEKSAIQDILDLMMSHSTPYRNLREELEKRGL
jgi:hypothetical protein